MFISGSTFTTTWKRQIWSNVKMRLLKAICGDIVCLNIESMFVMFLNMIAFYFPVVWLSVLFLNLL